VLRARLRRHWPLVLGALAACVGAGGLAVDAWVKAGRAPVDQTPRRVALIARGDWSDGVLDRLAEGQSTGGAAISRRAAARERWTPPGPRGWPRYDLARLPSLGFHDLSWDAARRINALIPPSPLAIEPARPFVLSGDAANRARAQHCLTQAVYFEAAQESDDGQAAVAQVVLNRVRHPGFPKTICGVVYQGAKAQTGCQFSFTCDGSLARGVATEAWRRAEGAAKRALAGRVFAPVGVSTHYYAAYVFPYWSPTLVKLRQIGAHIFFRMTGPDGTLAAFTGRYGGDEMKIPDSVLTGGDARTPNASVVVPQVGKPRTFTLAVGGEVKTYTVADPTTGAVKARVAGTIQPTRRAPTPDEVKAINESLGRLEAQRAAPAPGPAQPPPSTPPNP